MSGRGLISWFALALFGVDGCAATSAELIAGGQWSAAARLASANRDLCAPAMACSGAVQVMAAEGAGRAEVRAAAGACVLPRTLIGRQLLSWAGVAGAIEAVADVVAEQLRERAAARRAVFEQATDDLAAERARCGP